MTKYEVIKPSSTLLKPCGNVEITYSTNGELILSLIELSAEYNICKQKVSSLIEFYNLVEPLYSTEEGLAKLIALTKLWLSFAFLLTIDIYAFTILYK